MNVQVDAQLHPAWQGGSLQCIVRRDETHDCATFVLTAESPVRFDFFPGQFITLGLDVGGERHYRAYSISSCPTQSDRIAITVKRVEGGIMSNHLLDNFHVGHEVVALPPAGEFHLHPDQVPDRLVLLSAGSGITPVMSMARWLLKHRTEAHIHFIHSARSERDLIFHRELRELEMRHGNLQLEFFVSNPKSEIEVHKGRLTPERLDDLLHDAANSHIYMCGHPDYMAMIEVWHQERDYPNANLRKESFMPVEKEEVDGSGKTFQMRVPAFGVTTTILDGQPLIEIMEAEGLPIIAACRSGICGSCKCKVTAGEVERTSTETLTPEEVEAGYVLACSALARGDVEIELG